MNGQLPRRYGTAIHLTPPWADSNAIPLPAPREALGEVGLISDFWRDYVNNVAQKDAYLAWHLAHELPVRVIEVKAHQRQQITPPQPSPSLGEGAFSEVLLITLEEGGQLLLENDFTQQPHALRRVFVQQHAESQFEYVVLRHSVEFLNEQVDVQLVGEGAVCKTTHLVYGQGSEQVDIGVRVTHMAPHTESLLQARMAVSDTALALYRGVITIKKTAPGSKGYQQANGLLLSDTATVDCIPELVIKTDDVSCTHGVTITSLDELNTLYLRSRGLDEAHAERLAVRGFYEQKLTVPPATVRALDRFFRAL